MTRWVRKVSVLLAIGVVLSAASACGESLDNSQPSGQGANGGKETWPKTVTYGLLPTDDMDDLVSLYTPFEEYMARCLDHPFKLYPGTDYTAMVEAMRTGNVHVSRFGPFAYILAHDRAGAEAMAVAVQDASEVTYKSLIITRKSLGFDGIDDLQGKSFAFVDPASASGHLFPRAMIIEKTGVRNDEIENWFGNVVYAGNHEASLLSVLNGDTDAGALASTARALVNNNGVWEMDKEGEFANHANAADLMVLDESQDIPRTVEAIKNDLPDSLKRAVMSCFEKVADEPSLAEFRKEGAFGAGYVPAKDSDYDIVRDTAKSLGMSPEDLLDQ